MKAAVSIDPEPKKKDADKGRKCFEEGTGRQVKRIWIRRRKNKYYETSFIRNPYYHYVHNYFGTKQVQLHTDSKTCY
jgi:hypothetical protein